MQFPKESDTAPCTSPGNTPNIPIQGLHHYQPYGALLEFCGSVFRGPGVGLWERFGQHQFVARFKFFLFNPDFSRRGSKEVMSHIRHTGPDTFEATATLDRFDAARALTAQGCLINGTTARFE